MLIGAINLSLKKKDTLRGRMSRNARLLMETVIIEGMFWEERIDV
jgi:hypothetical protein